MDETQLLKKRIEKLEGIIYGLSDDVRFKAVVRKNVIDGEHTANKPVIVDKNGKKYNLQTV